MHAPLDCEHDVPCMAHMGQRHCHQLYGLQTGTHVLRRSCTQLPDAVSLRKVLGQAWLAKASDLLFYSLASVFKFKCTS